MDFATIIGIAAGLFLIIFQGIGDPAKVSMFIDQRSVAITIGGTVAAMFVAYPMSTIFSIFSMVKHVFFINKRRDAELVKQIVGLAEQSRREGILSLEAKVRTVEDEYLRRGLLLAVDGTEPSLIRDILTIEAEGVDVRHRVGIHFFEDMGALAPAFGMIGTLIGLVLMLANMSDPSSIGPSMAVAFLTTFYGAILANLFCLPLAVKLKGLHAQEMHTRSMIIEGVISLQSGENPRLVEAKLMAFISPDQRFLARNPQTKRVLP